MKNQLYTIATAVLFTVATLSAGCVVPTGTNPEPRCPSVSRPVTRILDIIVTPETVVEGDTAFIKVVVEDSLLEGLQYAWGFQSTTACSAEWIGGYLSEHGICISDTNIVGWIAPDVSTDTSFIERVEVFHFELANDEREHNDDYGCWYGAFNEIVSGAPTIEVKNKL